MDRLSAAKESFQQHLETYNETTKSKPLSITELNEAELSKLLDTVTLRESIEQRRTGKTTKANSDFKANIADLLLLLDGFDIKQKKAAAAGKLEEAEEVS
ncbi:hypothetical protein JQC92_19575 [Shewanella sp. 202IG2-18]|uniref:hypothetical protein n=1 Tax=Parashewanella hymeniacidonis TaxID=2807618 RepID=UPI0019606043|nr:hypothetical protein [Parashewanella hymeniacidonis]MBM7074200.1 hypothetical protein [Parashewanella hymeniacidonis]